MGKFLKIEFNQIIKNWSFWTAAVIGLLLSISQYFMTVLPMVKYLDTYKSAGLSMIMPHTVFSKWIGGEAVSVQHFSYFLIIPLLSVMPWSASTYTDKKRGIIKNYFIRAHKYHYYFAKLIANFIVGGGVSVVPLITSLLLTSGTLPSIRPEVSAGTFAIRSDSMFSELFYTHPYVYIFIYIFIIFVFCGLIASFASSIGIWIDNSFSVVIFPFIIHLFLYTICSSMNARKFAPFYFLDPFQNANSINLGIILLEGAVLIALSAFSVIWGIRNETL